jgi:hypothetical protein
VMGITQGLGAFLLLPVALLVQAGLGTIGLAVYAIVFALAGTSGIAELFVVRRLRRPGRVRVAPRGQAPPPAPATLRFIRTVSIAAFGAGFGPYLSIYAISVLGLTAGFAIVLSALASAASLVTAAVVGGMLGRGSSSRTLRLSFVLRGGSMVVGLLAFPANPLAWAVLCLVAILAAAGASAGILASNERLLRLTGGVDLIGAQGRFVAGTAAGLTAGQFSSGAVLAVLPLGYPAFALLFGVSGAVRLILAARAEVSPTWASATAAFDVEQFRRDKR